MWKALRRVVGTGATVIVAMTQMTPEQAVSNLSAWAERNNLPSLNHFVHSLFFTSLLSNIVWTFAAIALASFTPDLWRLNKRVVNWSERRSGSQQEIRHISSAFTAHERTLKIDVGEGDGFEDFPSNPAGTIRRVLSVAIRNTGAGVILDCELRIVDLLPTVQGFTPGILLGAADIHEGHPRFVQVAHYNEASLHGGPGQAIYLCTPFSNALGGGFGSLPINKEQRAYDLVLEAAARGMEPTRARIRLSVDLVTHQLKMKRF